MVLRFMAIALGGGNEVMVVDRNIMVHKSGIRVYCNVMMFLVVVWPSCCRDDWESYAYGN